MFKTCQRYLPFVLLFILFIFLYQQLSAPATTLHNSLVGRKVPAFVVQDLQTKTDSWTHHELKNRLTLLNIWATWCTSCVHEHAQLLRLAEDYHVPIYGLNYKDDADKARMFLKEHGNPYQRIGVDAAGEIAIDFGVYALPETFVIDANGYIIYHHIGALTQDVMQTVFIPLIKNNL